MVKIAIMGYGTVGAGVAKVIEQNQDIIRNRANTNIEVKYILDIRDFPDSPYANKMIQDFAIIEQDPEIQIVVETIGGKKVAYEFTKRALLAGKHVVTSNKELVATYGTELLAIAKERTLNYLFEASVGGGIPSIRPLTQCMLANHIEQICGILNGTTNYILTRMIHAGKPFEDALREAQEKGYAEANPSADVDGIDACRKICILTNLSYGKWVDPEAIYTEGIRHISLEDVQYAKEAGMAIKLLGRCVRRPDGRVNVLVAPHLIPFENPLSGVSDVFNAIMVTGDAVGDVMFYGQGAGALPTASAVTADIIDITKHLNRARKLIGWENAEKDFVAPWEEMQYRFYIRAKNCDGQMFPNAKVLLNTQQECVLITQSMQTSQCLETIAKLKQNGATVLSMIRVLN